jgi:hypothetical protein
VDRENLPAVYIHEADDKYEANVFRDARRWQDGQRDEYFTKLSRLQELNPEFDLAYWIEI